VHRTCPKCGKRGIPAWRFLADILVCRQCQSSFRKVWYWDWPWQLVVQCMAVILPLATIISVFYPLYFAVCIACWALLFAIDALIPLREFQIPRPSEAEIAVARSHPDGWVYRIAGPFGPHDAVPPEAIVGDWKVNARGEIVGEFDRNRRYNPALWSSGQITSRTEPAAK
jgi:hypothetical protein